MEDAAPQADSVVEPSNARSSYFSMPVDAASAGQAPSEEAFAAPAEAVVAAAAPVAAREPAQAPAARPAPAAALPVAPPVSQALPKVAAFTLSVDAMQQVAQASGLEWVNSNAAKVAEVQAAIAAEPRAIHVPREVSPAVVLDDGPLVLVETRKDLRNTTLPFENPANS